MQARPYGVFVWFTSALFLALGCSKGREEPAPKAADQADSKNSGALRPTQTSSLSAAPGNTVLLPFREAVLFEPPDGEQRPPDRTSAGKNVAALYEQIAGQEGAAGLWDKIALTTPAGNWLRYTARLNTDLGTIEIELYTESAPNHVRNFIALAQTGYYNGLPFHRSLSGKVDGETLAYLEGGCPMGSGESGFGSIGYWLKPEISPSLTHEEGSVGAVRGQAFESAACKFYISLTRSPGMDGGYTIFGKITKGLDIAHAINKRPVVDDGDLSDRPRQPVIIREVTIQAGSSSPAVVAHN